jgi:hypothetical protein
MLPSRAHSRKVEDREIAEFTTAAETSKCRPMCG